jgi:drug/metabolite transporter (DMT)-like permease
MIPFGPLAALGASFTWAYATTRYTQASRDVGSARVNLARATVVLPIFLVLALVAKRGALLDGIDGPRALWLLASVTCSYALGDNLFFTASRRIGISTALAIASIYPLWAALFGVVLRHERFGPLRLAGTVLCVGGVVALVRLAPGMRAARDRLELGGLVLALATSLFWAGNSITIKLGAEGIGPFQANAVRYGFAVLLLVPQALLWRAPGQATSPTGGWRRVLPAIFADALLGSALYVYGLSHSDLAVGATLSSLAPLISVPLAIWAGEERWSLARFVAVLATVSGAALLIAAT